MKTLRTFALLVVLASMLVAGFAQAQSPTLSVYVGPDKASYKQVLPYQEFSIWVVMHDIQASVNAVEYQLTLPPQMVVLNQGFYPGSIQLGNQIEGFAVGLGECVPMYDGLPASTLVVQEIRGYNYGTYINYTLSLQPLGTGQGGSVPRFSDCDGQLHDLATENAVMMCTTVDTAGSSWGAVKTLYDGQ